MTKGKKENEFRIDDRKPTEVATDIANQKKSEIRIIKELMDFIADLEVELDEFQKVINETARMFEDH